MVVSKFARSTGPMNQQPSQTVFRLATFLFAILLSVQCVWLVVAGFFLPGINRLPADAVAAIAARSERADAGWAATIGAIRGDLWAELAFTYAGLMWSDGEGGSVTQARSALDHALANAPHQSGAWLLLTGLASRYPLPGIDATAALKMSYYTGPSDLKLMPLRLQIAVHSEALSDIELRELISRDVRVLLAHQRNSAIASAYNVASSAARVFIEQTVGEIDPLVAKSLRTSAPRQSLPK